MITDLELNDYVKLVGETPHSEIPSWMHGSSIFVLPSLSEGNPTVMFEALGCGKPFVGTKVGGIPEIIVDDRLGILVNPGDSEALAQAIQQALERKWDHAFIQEYARQFTWENIASKMMEVYKEILMN
jgi:glycosyltransferase involved in cell wall biosynthesis